MTTVDVSATAAKLEGASILVTGGQGFIGRHLAGTLRQVKGARIVIASRRTNATDGVAVDLSDRSSVRAAFHGQSFDVVFHCAGVIDQGVRPGLYESQWQAHVQATLNLVEEVSASRFIHVGSNAEYGAAPCPQHGDGPAYPNSAYGVSKLAATALVRAKCVSEGLRATVVRPFLVYGPGQAERSFLGLALEAARQGKPFPTSPGGQTRDLVPVDWVVRDLLKSAMDDSTAGMVVNSCTGHEFSLRRVLEILKSIVPTFAPEPGAVPYRATELMRSSGVPFTPVSADETEKSLATFLAAEVKR